MHRAFYGILDGHLVDVVWDADILERIGRSLRVIHIEAHLDVDGVLLWVCFFVFPGGESGGWLISGFFPGHFSFLYVVNKWLLFLEDRLYDFLLYELVFIVEFFSS